MLNHARTLLLNRTAGTAGIPGEELVPVDFHPIVPLPNAVRKVYGLLFGTQPDRYMLNYRLAQLMPVWHETELEEFVLAYDQRITYWPLRETRLFKEAFQTVVTTRDGDGDLSPVGVAAADENRGQMYYHWRVDVVDSDTVNVRSLISPFPELAQSYVLTEGRSNLLLLPGSALRFTFAGQIGDSWYVEVVGRPDRSAGDLLASLKSFITGADDREIFGSPVSGNAATWQALWREHPYYAYQLGGLLLGVVDYLERHR